MMIISIKLGLNNIPLRVHAKVISVITLQQVVIRAFQVPELVVECVVLLLLKRLQHHIQILLRLPSLNLHIDVACLDRDELSSRLKCGD